MFISKLRTLNFRNLINQEVEIASPFTLLLGKNGQGKTSVLEAIFLLSSGKSFRASKFRDLLNNKLHQDNLNKGSEKQNPDKNFSVQGLVNSLSLEKKIAVNWSNGKRQIAVNDNVVSSVGQFFGQFSAVCFTAEDLFIVKGSPAIRRQFIDRLISQVDVAYLESLVRYHKALKHRKAVLESVEFRDVGTLLFWDKIISEQGEFIARKRQEFIKVLSESASRYYSGLLGIVDSEQQSEALKLGYSSHLLSDQSIITESGFLRLLADNRDRDFARKQTSVGIHRDDLEIYLQTEFCDFVLARNIASQGQCRSIAISLVLGAVDVLTKSLGDTPIILLDDVESELDSNRLLGLYALLRDLNSQVIVTSTDFSPTAIQQFPNVEVMRIEGGMVQK